MQAHLNEERMLQGAGQVNRDRLIRDKRRSRAVRAKQRAADSAGGVATRTSTNKRTPKQRVLRKFKNAYAHQGPFGLWAIFGSRFGGRYLYLSNPHKSAAVAWRDAAGRPR